MSYNENGLLVDAFTVQNYHSRVPQGAVVGIVLGWFFGAIGLYVLGLLIIWKCSKNRGDEDESRVSNSVDDKPAPGTMGTTKGKHRKQMFEQNPTLEMVNVTDSNEVDSHDINLNFTKNKPTRTQMNRQQDEEYQKQE